MEAPFIHIIERDDINPTLLAQLNQLIPQLSRSAQPMHSDDLQNIVSAPHTDLFVARSHPESPLLGMLTLVHFRIPTGLRAWIEDVVVDHTARGQGMGTALIQAAMQRAQEIGTKTLDLTSNPSRQAAHRLYEVAGFKARDTCVYRFMPPKP